MSEACKVLVGVCGGIAAYKSAELVRELQRAWRGGARNHDAFCAGVHAAVDLCLVDRT